MKKLSSFDSEKKHEMCRHVKDTIDAYEMDFKNYHNEILEIHKEVNKTKAEATNE